MLKRETLRNLFYPWPMAFATLLAITPLAVLVVVFSRLPATRDIVPASTTVVDTLQVNGALNTKSVITRAPCDAGLLPAQTILSDWNPGPGCLTSSSLITAQASDNSGSIVTGLSATSIAIGTTVTLCNLVGPEDASVIALTNLDVQSLAANRILTPNAGQGGRCSVTTSTACHLDSQCPVGETCAIDNSRYVIAPDMCSELVYLHPWTTVGDNTGVAWVVKGKTRFYNDIMQNLVFYPSLFTDVTNGTVDDFNPTCVSVACKAAHTYVCAPGAVNCGESGDDLRFMSNTVVFLNTSAGLDVRGFHYESQALGAAGLGPYKQIINGGTANVVLENDAAANPINNIEDGATGDVKGNITLLPGQSVVVWHGRDAGPWYVIGKRDAWYQTTLFGSAGANFTGTDSTNPLGAGIASNVSATHQVGGLVVGATTEWDQITGRELSTVDTTAAGATFFGVRGIANAHRVAGANPVINRGCYCSAQLGDDNVGVFEDAGDVILCNAGGTLDVRGPSLLRHNVALGDALQIVSGHAPTSVSHGSLTTGSTDWWGNITGIGANSSVVLTFSSAFPTRSWCSAWSLSQAVTTEQVIPTCIAASCTFACVSTITGAAANCNDIGYNCVGGQ